MQNTQKNKTLFIALGLVAVLLGVTLYAVSAVRKYTHLHTVSAGTFYTQIPLNQTQPQDTQNQSYTLRVFDEYGTEKIVTFTAQGTTASYTVGTYLQLQAMDNVIIAQTIVTQSQVPEQALTLIQKKGTKAS